MKHFTLVLFSALCVACATTRQAAPSEKIVTETRIETVYETDTVYLEVPQIVEKVVTKDTVSVLENEFAKSAASVSDGLLAHSLETKPVQKPVVVQTKTVYRDSIIFKDVVVYETVEDIVVNVGIKGLSVFCFLLECRRVEEHYAVLEYECRRLGELVVYVCSEIRHRYVFFLLVVVEYPSEIFQFILGFFTYRYVGAVHQACVEEMLCLYCVAVAFGHLCQMQIQQWKFLVYVQRVVFYQHLLVPVLGLVVIVEHPASFSAFEDERQRLEDELLTHHVVFEGFRIVSPFECLVAFLLIGLGIFFLSVAMV